MNKRKKLIKILAALIVLVVICTGGYSGYKMYQLEQLKKMSFTDMLAYTTKNNENARITVGVIDRGVIDYTVYGKNGIELSKSNDNYEIGSITKTFTASLVNKAVIDGTINLDETIDNYIDLPDRDGYPTIKSLLTHTSGYKDWYFETQMVSNFFTKNNDYYGISKETLIDRISKVVLEDKDYDFRYSSFGTSVLGLVLENVYNDSYCSLVKRYVSGDLSLENTICSNDTIDLDSSWDWHENDAYLPAGGLVSNIDDMLRYAQLLLSNDNGDIITNTQNSLAVINAGSAVNEKMNIHIDEIGMNWIIDNTNHIIWHNGGTGHYNSYIGIDKLNNRAVVILSNLSPKYRIPATVMGIKLLTTMQE